MSQLRIGQVLRKTAWLSELDVEEILLEQDSSHRRFGEIAISWGLCAPHDVWRAWYRQLGDATPWIDLDHFGVDSQAVAQVPRNVAMQFHILPLRVLGDQLVAAIAVDAANPPAQELGERIHKDVRFVRAEPRKIAAALSVHYPEPISAH